jgi:phage terminase large subunit
MQLDWHPQPAFADYFYTDESQILANRSVFRGDLEFFVAYGGRGSAKTWTFADALVIEGSLRPIRILVTRELQNSIEESIKAEIEAAIDNRGLHHFYEIQNNVIKGANGTRFVFRGLKNNIHNIKSISDVDVVLCEEAENITKLSWDKLLPSIRPRDKFTRGGTPIVAVIFNPANELDDTYQRWVISPPPATLSKLINFTDNKYFPPHLDRQRIHFKKTRPKKDYDHEWLGMPTGQGDDIIIDLEWLKAARFASRSPLFKKTGDKVVGYDPAGQGKDFHAAIFADGNILSDVDEWLLSPDLREASKRAFGLAIHSRAVWFRYDECGGLGDGVDVFLKDEKADTSDYEAHKIAKGITIVPFNAGSGVIGADKPINPEVEKSKLWGEVYSNAKAQAWGIFAQKLYTTYRLIVLGETDMKADEVVSIDFIDDDLFLKLCQEASKPIWIKSKTNSKKRVEDKKETEKRTGQPSGNLIDSAVMAFAPKEENFAAMVF